MSQKPTVGRIVHFFPGTQETNKLPNGMTHAAAIITQVFGEGENASCNMNLFLAETDSNKKSVVQKWSINHKSTIASAEASYWDWPARD